MRCRSATTGCIGPASLTMATRHISCPLSREKARNWRCGTRPISLRLRRTERDWDTAVQRAEVEMLERAELSAAEARDGINGAFSENCPVYMVEQMQGQCG